MDFEEKIDAMRTTLELAIHDIEAQRTNTQEMRAAMQETRAAMQESRAAMQETRAAMQDMRISIQELRMLSEHQHESIQALMKISGELVQTVTVHDKRIGAIEGRI